MYIVHKPLLEIDGNIREVRTIKARLTEFGKHEDRFSCSNGAESCCSLHTQTLFYHSQIEAKTEA